MNKYLKFLLNPGFRFNILASRGFYNSMSDIEFLKKSYMLSMKKDLDLNNPQTFSEKLQWLKLYNRKPEYTIMVDKYAAKEYVADIIGHEYIIPTLGVWDRFEDIDFDALPNQFVLKCTHDSGGLVICKDKSKLNKNKACKKIKKSLKRNYYYQNREWPYKDVPPRIIAEHFVVGNNQNDLPDYKFFCFNGEPQYCQVISGRNSITTIDWYDKNWIHQPFQEPKNYPFSEKGHCKPRCLEEMLVLARRLSQGHPFLRVDFYEVNNKIKFGELTFFPTSGMGGFEPDEWDYTFGSWIKLPEVKD